MVLPHRSWMQRVSCTIAGKMFQDVGIVGKARKLAIKKVLQAAERSSSRLWLRRNASSWKPSTNG
ncbi:hypothetical protein DPMN_071319 [Dreissena polymorpha]|uniref:Uncharacterized protein n=1 Tax=Dreissena polymorpha TaxID=45954 RepID=A0A9D4BXB9_DREPO|nr:hypothetical protein DPMN_071319 [Dreissena polymorpha]